jgi:hypothetical protein
LNHNSAKRPALALLDCCCGLVDARRLAQRWIGFFVDRAELIIGSLSIAAAVGCLGGGLAIRW